MFAQLNLVNISDLKQHEKTNPSHLFSLREQIKKDGGLHVPIVVDVDSMVVLDGHHRLNSCIQMGFKKIPCLLVDYLGDQQIKVSSRRKKINITKGLVIAAALTGSLFPHKTTAHFIPYQFKKLFIPLTNLQ